MSARPASSRATAARAENAWIIERVTCLKIPEILELYGESVFRDYETEVVRRTLRLDEVVVATGGGTPVDPANRALMRAQGRIVHLAADLELCRANLAASGADRRPLWRDDAALAEIERTRPLSVVMAAPIQRLRQWAQGRTVAADEPKLTGFVFKIQANMNPKHRDRIAFMRVVSGRFERGMQEYADAELALERGRNIEIVRSNAADATSYFRTATTAAELAATALAQVMKSRQDAANARAPQLEPEIWQQAQRKFGDAIRMLELRSGNFHRYALIASFDSKRSLNQQHVLLASVNGLRRRPQRMCEHE